MEKLVKELIEIYPKLGKPTDLYRCGYILFSDDEKEVLKFLPTPCHSKLTVKYNPAPAANTYDHLLTSFNATDVHWFTFFDFLTGHLFKQWAQYIHLNCDPKTGKYYIHVTDLDKIPAQVLYSFCIFSRVPKEFGHYVLRWEELVKSGINPGVAFALCRVIIDEDGKATDVWGTDSVGHWPMDRTMSLERLATGKPVYKPNNMYRAHTDQCTPTNSIWGDTQDLRGLPVKPSKSSGTIGKRNMKTFYSHLDRDGVATLFRDSYGLREVQNPESADVIILNGGEDIATSIYSELPIHRGIPAQPTQRDKDEIRIFEKYAGHPTKIILGICRGGQLLNCLNGGSLYQDVNGHHGSHKMVDLRTGEVLDATSTHHQAFIPNLDTGQVIGVSSQSTAKRNEAGIQHYEKQTDLTKGRDVEIVWYPQTHCLCIQGHPEYYPESRFSDFTLELLNAYYPKQEKAA